MRRTNIWTFSYLLCYFIPPVCTCILDWEFLRNFRIFSGFCFWIFLLDFLKKYSWLRTIQDLMDKWWNFLYIYHMMREVSHMTCITCCYIAFTVHLAQVSSQIGLLMEKVMWTDCTVLHSQGWLSYDEEESYYFLSCNISLTLTPQLYRNVSRTFYPSLTVQNCAISPHDLFPE